MIFHTGCSFQSVYFEVCAKIVNFHPILTKYGSFEGQGLGIYEFAKKVWKNNQTREKVEIIWERWFSATYATSPDSHVSVYAMYARAYTDVWKL